MFLLATLSGFLFNMHLLKALFFGAKLTAKTSNKDAEYMAEDDKLTLYHKGRC